MKHVRNAGTLTFGDLISSLYRACDSRRAVAIIRLAVNARLLAIPLIRQRLSAIGKPVAHPSVH